MKRVALTIIGTVLVSGCLPTYQQAGVASSIAAPPLFVAGIATAGLLWLLWRFATGHRGRFQHGVSSVCLCVLAAISAAVIPLWWADSLGIQSWLDDAFIYLGGSYIALLLVIWRIWVALDADRSFSWAPIASLAVLLLPALAVLPFAATKLTTSDPFFLLWICPGCWSFLRKIFEGTAGWGDWPGSGTAVVGALLLLELTVRGCRRLWSQRAVSAIEALAAEA